MHQSEADTFISKAGGFYPVKTYHILFFFFSPPTLYVPLNQMAMAWILCLTEVSGVV